MKPTDPRQVILRPVVTEKSLRTSERTNAYTFEVHPKANKVQIRTAVRSGKPRRLGFRFSRTPDRKRAIVVVKQGQSLDVY